MSCQPGAIFEENLQKDLPVVGNSIKHVLWTDLGGHDPGIHTIDANVFSLVVYEYMSIICSSDGHPKAKPR